MPPIRLRSSSPAASSPRHGHRSISAGRRRVAILALIAMVAAACGGADDVVDTATALNGADIQATSVALAANAEAAGADAAEPTVAATPIPSPTPTPKVTATPLPIVTVVPTATPQPERTTADIRPPGDWDIDIIVAKNSTGFVPVYDGPDGEPFDLKYEYLNGGTVDYPLLNPTFFGGPLTLMVLEGTPEDDRVKVQLPVRPQGAVGWVETKDFTFTRSEWLVEVDVSTNMVRAWQGEELMHSSSVITGKRSHPTPVLSTYIDDKQPGSNFGSAYGDWVLSLASFSESHNTFGSRGGLPKLALHGTNVESRMGEYISNGCIRLVSSAIGFIAEHVPVGSPVNLVRSQ